MQNKPSPPKPAPNPKPQVRSLKVQPKTIINRYNQKDVPEIRFYGNWLQKLGFLPEQRVTITTLPRLLLIRVVEKEEEKEEEHKVELKLLKTFRDYRTAHERLEDLSGAKPNTPESNEAEVLLLLLNEYEQRKLATMAGNSPEPRCARARRARPSSGYLA